MKILLVNLINTIFINQVLLFIILTFNTNSTLKSQDSPNNSIYHKIIVPSSLIATGIIVSNSLFEQNVQDKLKNMTGNDFHCSIDDYFQFAPVVEMYIGDGLRVKSKNHWFDQTKYLFISNLFSTGISQAIKRSVLKIRPDGSPYSFPSGHTTIAFTNAAVLFNEYKNSSPLLAYSGYFFSTSTGILRILNNRHWLSDVLTGAGLGILVTQLVYYFQPLKNFNPFIKSKDIVLIPQINEQKYSIGFVYSF